MTSPRFYLYPQHFILTKQGLNLNFKRQSGTTILIISIILALGATVGILSYISAHNYGNEAEQGIIAHYDDMQNVLGPYSLKVVEAANVPSMYAGDMKDVMTSVMSARQGEGGSKATFQWFKEHNLELDSSLYAKNQTIIEAGRNEFQNSQTKLIDAKQMYNTSLGSFWKGMWMDVAGYPSINLDDYGIISSNHAKTAFETKVDTAIKF